MERAGSQAEALLVLHDRVDELTGKPSRGGWGILSGLALVAMGGLV